MTDLTGNTGLDSRSVKEERTCWKKYITLPFLSRYLVVLLSVVFVGLGASITRISCMGTECFTSLNYSISEFLGISIGSVMAAISAILLILAFFFYRRGLGPGTVLLMTCLGYSADFWGRVIVKITGESICFSGMEHMLLRFLLFFVGMFIMILFSSFYLAADVGISAYDTLGYILEKYTGIAFQWVRVFLDVICVVLTFLFASQKGTQWELIGMGTLIMASGVGPVMMFLLHHISAPLVNRLCGEKRDTFENTQKSRR